MGCILKNHFPWRNMHSVFSDCKTCCFMHVSRVQQKPLYLPFFVLFCSLKSATQHCTPQKPTSLSHFLKSLFWRWKLRPNEVSCRLHLYIIHFEGPHSYLPITYVLFCFSYCDDNCVSPNKPLSDEFLRGWLFGESETSTCR